MQIKKLFEKKFRTRIKFVGIYEGYRVQYASYRLFCKWIDIPEYEEYLSAEDAIKIQMRIQSVEDVTDWLVEMHSEYIEKALGK